MNDFNGVIDVQGQNAIDEMLIKKYLIHHLQNNTAN